MMRTYIKRHKEKSPSDQIEILSTDDSALDFISGYSASGVKKFIYVDDLSIILVSIQFFVLLNGRVWRILTLSPTFELNSES